MGFTLFESGVFQMGPPLFPIPPRFLVGGDGWNITYTDPRETHTFFRYPTLLGRERLTAPSMKHPCTPSPPGAPTGTRWPRRGAQ